MLSHLRKTNENLIKMAKIEKNEELLKKQELIKVLLSREDCFFEMPMNVAVSVLIDLGQTEEVALKNYKELTSPNEFKRVKLNKKG